MANNKFFHSQISIDPPIYRLVYFVGFAYGFAFTVTFKVKVLAILLYIGQTKSALSNKSAIHSQGFV